MAVTAARDLQARNVTVNRVKLIAQLKENLAVHTAEYEEALKNYQALVLKQIKEGYDKALSKAKVHLDVALKRASKFDPFHPELSKSSWRVMDSVYVKVAVPKSYAKMYQTAIEIAEWETGETMVLTYAEFSCYIRDEWDWKGEFQDILRSYTACETMSGSCDEDEDED